MSLPQQPQAGGSVAPAELARPDAPGSGRTVPAQKRLSGARWWREVGWRHVVGVIAVVFAVVPVLYLVSASLNPQGSVVTTGVIPTTFSLVHFERLFTTPSIPYLTWYRNTIVVAVSVTAVQVFCSALAAYAFSRFRFRGRRGGLLTLLLIQLFPQFLAAIALFIMFTSIGEVIPALGLNTIAGYALVLFGGALGQVWLIKGFFDTLPGELDEAAVMDGAGHARIFFTILLPLVRPIIAITGLIAFIGVVSEFLLASVFLTDNDAKTLAVGLYGLLATDRSNNLGIFAASSIMLAIPVVVLFLFLQRYIVGGITSGAVKG
jgi:arabinogalactan oligomer / maltooligosaccharide transport system permease protein